VDLVNLLCATTARSTRDRDDEEGIAAQYREDPRNDCSIAQGSRHLCRSDKHSGYMLATTARSTRDRDANPVQFSDASLTLLATTARSTRDRDQINTYRYFALRCQPTTTARSTRDWPRNETKAEAPPRSARSTKDRDSRNVSSSRAHFRNGCSIDQEIETRAGSRAMTTARSSKRSRRGLPSAHNGCSIDQGSRPHGDREQCFPDSTHNDCSIDQRSRQARCGDPREDILATTARSTSDRDVWCQGSKPQSSSFPVQDVVPRNDCSIDQRSRHEVSSLRLLDRPGIETRKPLGCSPKSNKLATTARSTRDRRRGAGARRLIATTARSLRDRDARRPLIAHPLRRLNDCSIDQGSRRGAT